jgi:hypothetical protein
MVIASRNRTVVLAFWFSKPVLSILGKKGRCLGHAGSSECNDASYPSMRARRLTPWVRNRRGQTLTTIRELATRETPVTVASYR